ncbi:MAG: cyclase family protein [Symbiobacterium sp.]|uniref:cyclase family protein n=1 Tax=Symbiobacterium sp. TaxID=1971213 RepID=UPI0034642706
MRVIDLTLGYSHGMPAYGTSWYKRVEIRPLMTPETDPTGHGRRFSQFILNPHNATHVDAPSHFVPGGKDVSDLDLGLFIGPALVLDLTHKGLREPVTADDLAAAARGRMRPGLRLLLRTDYVDRHWGDPDFWQKPPYLAPSAADWCVEQGAVLVGLDFLTEEPGDRAFPVHKRLLQAGIPILEYLCNLKSLTGPIVWLMAAPMQVIGAEAAPVRALAFDGPLPPEGGGPHGEG